jgi:hypothetical protein
MAVDACLGAVLVVYWIAVLDGTPTPLHTFLAALPPPGAPPPVAPLRQTALTAFTGFPLPVSTHTPRMGAAVVDGPIPHDASPVGGSALPTPRRRQSATAVRPVALGIAVLSAAALTAQSLAAWWAAAQSTRSSRFSSEIVAILSTTGSTTPVAPATIIGDGPLERLLARPDPNAAAGGTTDALLTADQWVAADGLEAGPILFCGPLETLDPAVESTPAPRRRDIVVLHDGIVDPVLERYGISMAFGADGATQCLADLHDEDGRLVDRHPEGLTIVSGCHSTEVIERLARWGIPCRATDPPVFRSVALQHLAQQAAFNLVGAKFRVGTVGAVAAERAEEASEVLRELLSACRCAHPELPLDPEDVAVDYALLAYAPQYANRAASLAEFPRTNAFFWTLSQRAIEAGRGDPCPLHTRWVEDVGVPGVVGRDRSDTAIAQRLSARDRTSEGSPSPAASAASSAPGDETLTGPSSAALDGLVGAFSGKTDLELAEDLMGDIERFRNRPPSEDAAKPDSGLRTGLQTVSSGLGTLLSYNFIIIVAFFLWFLLGIVSAYGFKNEGLIREFQGRWDGLIFPLLTTHMTLTFVSKGIEMAAEKIE